MFAGGAGDTWGHVRTYSQEAMCACVCAQDGMAGQDCKTAAVEKSSGGSTSPCSPTQPTACSNKFLKGGGGYTNGPPKCCLPWVPPRQGSGRRGRGLSAERTCTAKSQMMHVLRASSHHASKKSLLAPLCRPLGVASTTQGPL